jgi:DNA-binding MltR family transcriptional regulator
MPYSITPDVVAQFGRVLIMMNGQFDHRGMVIRAVCQLEDELALLLFVHFRSQKSSLRWAHAKRRLFSENGILSTLTKMLTLASYLDLVADEEVHDLRALIDMRNKYAHRSARGQLGDDQYTTAKLESLILIQRSQAELAGIDHQGQFRSACHVLMLRLQAKREAICPGSVAADTPN